MTVPRGLVVKHEIPPANVPDFFQHMRLSRKLVWDRFGQNAKKRGRTRNPPAIHALMQLHCQYQH